LLTESTNRRVGNYLVQNKDRPHPHLPRQRAFVVSHIARDSALKKIGGRCLTTLLNGGRLWRRWTRRLEAGVAKKKRSGQSWRAAWETATVGGMSSVTA